MHLLPLDISDRQAAKLRRGHTVRVKHGTGFNVIVNPETYRLATRTFKKGKGSELKLSDEELAANRALSPEAHEKAIQQEDDSFHTDKLIGGGSLFGSIKKGFDKFRKGKTGREIISMLKPAAKMAINEIATQAKQSNNPYAGMVAGAAQHGANNYVDNFNKDSHPSGGGLGAGVSKLKGLQMLNKHIGTNMGYLGRANIDNAIMNGMSAGMAKSSVDMRHMINPTASHWDSEMGPPSRGNGINHHPALRRTHGLVQGRGALHHGDGNLPPALISQPFGANFQFQHFLPPQYQHIHSIGGGLGAGLYA